MTIGWKVIDANNDSMVKTYIVDTEEYITSLPTKFLGSSAICISTGEVYMLNTEGVWKKIELDGSVPGGNGDNSAVTDVRIDGSSIVVDGVADIPNASANNAGLAKVNRNWGINSNTDGTLYTEKAADDLISNRTSNYRPIVPANLDYAVKAAMCDEKGQSWTETERLNARKRIGLGGDFELIEEITLESDVSSVTRNVSPFGKSYALKGVAIVVDTTAGRSNSTYVRVGVDGRSDIFMGSISASSDSFSGYALIQNRMLIGATVNGTNVTGTANTHTSTQLFTGRTLCDLITSVVITSNITSGTVIRIYGVWT